MSIQFSTTNKADCYDKTEIILIHIFAMTDSTNLISGRWSSGHILYDHPFFYNEIVTFKEQCLLLCGTFSSISSTSWGIYDDN